MADNARIAALITLHSQLVEVGDLLSRTERQIVEMESTIGVFRNLADNLRLQRDEIRELLKEDAN